MISIMTCLPAAAQLGPGDDQEWHPSAGVRISDHARQSLIPETYTVRQGDTLWDVTGRFYGNPWEWPRVWSYNPEITNPHWIYPLDQLRLLGANEHGYTSSTEPGVQIRPRRSRLQPGTVFLREQGYLDRDALDDSGVIIGSPEDHMMLAPFDDVYIEFDADYQGAPTGELSIFRTITPGEREPNEQGTLVRIFGAVRIDSYDRDRRTARATIIEALDPIERGYRVAPIPRRFDLVPPRVADRDLETQVVATLRPQQLLGEEQVVFVPVGGEQGVQVGYRFFIVRATDRWRDSVQGSATDSMGATVEPPPQPQSYPPEIVGEGRVVDVRPNSSTLILTRSVHEAQVGDRAEMRRGY